MEKKNFCILLLFVVILTSLCNSQDYEYDDYNYNEYYDYNNQKPEDYTDDYSQDSNDYYDQNDFLRCTLHEIQNRKKSYLTHRPWWFF